MKHQTLSLKELKDLEFVLAVMGQNSFSTAFWFLKCVFYVVLVIVYVVFNKLLVAGHMCLGIFKKKLFDFEVKLNTITEMPLL